MMESNNSSNNSSSSSSSSNNYADPHKQAAADVKNAAVSEEEQICNALIAVLMDRKKFPHRQRDVIIPKLAKQLMMELQCDVHGMLTEREYSGNPTYKGLDNTRDTEEEVETMVRHFPLTLAKKKGFNWALAENDDDFFYYPERDQDPYPIQCLMLMPNRGEEQLVRNYKAIPFIHVVAKLAIEFESFDIADRGGLLLEDDLLQCNVLQQLMYQHYGEYDNDGSEDIRFNELVALRASGVLLKQHIQQYHLVRESLVFAEQRDILSPCTRFLIEWDPASLLHGDINGGIPLHFCHSRLSSSILHLFCSIFQIGMLYFPYKIGICLLFKKDENGSTPFQGFCCGETRNKAKQAISDVLGEHSKTKPELNIIDAIYFAAINSKIHLDCVYFLLQRHPQVSMHILQHLQQSNNTNGNSNDNSNGKNNRKRKRNA